MSYFEYYKSLLKDNALESHYAILLRNIKQGSDNFTVDIPFSSDLLKVYEALRYDHPEIYFISDAFTIAGNDKKTTCSVGRIIDKNDSRVFARRIATSIKSIFSCALQLNDYEKTQFVYEWFMNNVTYSKDTQNCRNIIGALIEKVSCCQGIAFAAKLIFDYLKIKSIIVGGHLLNLEKKEPHAWNIVYINKVPYHFDATMGLNGLHNFLNASDVDVNKDHFFERGKYPECVSDVDNYYVRNNLLLPYDAQIIDSFLRGSLRWKKEVEIKIKGACGDLSSELLDRAAKNKFSILPKRYSINYDRNQQVYKITVM